MGLGAFLREIIDERDFALIRLDVSVSVSPPYESVVGTVLPTSLPRDAKLPLNLYRIPNPLHVNPFVVHFLQVGSWRSQSILRREH